MIDLCIATTYNNPVDETMNEALKKLEENRREQENIKNNMTLLPKGHINILYRNNKGYYYLTHREGKKICNDYLGPVGKTDLSDMIERLNQRERYKKELSKYKEEETALKKIIGRNEKKDVEKQV